MRFQFYATRLGNHFMQEIAEFYVRGLQEAGFEAQLIFDEIPQAKSGAIAVVVAPHEFYPLFLEKKYDEKTRNSIVAQTVLLNTEQPGTSWFKKTVQLASLAQGVIDFNRLGVKAFHDYGIPALYWPIPYTELLEATNSVEKEVDFVFLGYASSRRTKFFAQHAEFFSQFENRFIFSHLNQVRTETTPGCYFGEGRNDLIRRSKILLNIHGTENRYFEWHRALIAMANNCVFVTDESDEYAPLVSGEHLVVAPYDQLKEACLDLISYPQKREAIAQNAFHEIQKRFSPQKLFGNAKREIDELLQNHSRQKNQFKFVDETKEESVKPKKSFFNYKKEDSKIKLIPKRDIQILDHGYSSLGEDPQFRIQKCGEEKWSDGWYVLTFHLRAKEKRIVPEVYITSRGDFRDSAPIFIQEISKGKFQGLIRLSPKVKEIRLDPMSEEGEFELSQFHLQPIDIASNAASLLLDHLQKETLATIHSQAKLEAQRSYFLGQHKLNQLAKLQGIKAWEIEKNSSFDLTEPKLSVVVTLYNYKNFIRECLESVANSEDLLQIEIIVVDDASSDAGKDIVSQWMHQTALPCVLIKKVFNTGLAESRNIGIEQSRAPYVFILDADNKLFPKGLSHLYRWIQKKDWDFAFGMLQRFNSDTNKGLGLLSYYEWDEKHLLQEPYIDAMALFRKKAISACGGYQTVLGQQAIMGWEDYDLWLNLLDKNFRGGLYPNFVGAYRVHGSSMIQKAAEHVAEIGNYFQQRYAHLSKRFGVEGKIFGWKQEFLCK